MRCLVLCLWVGCAGGGDPSPTGGTDSPLVTTDPYDTIEANFPWEEREIDGFGAMWHVPSDPVGLVWVFHGTNGNLAAITQAEWLLIYNQLDARGIGIVATNSTDRATGQWDLEELVPSANADFPRLAQIRQVLLEETALQPDTPHAALGFSQGAGFTSTFASMATAEGWDLRGLLKHQGAGSTTSLPSLYVSAENDENGQTPDRLGPVAEECAAATSADCPHRVGLEIPLDPLRFARMPEFSQEQSTVMFEELVELGIVDPSGGRLIELEDMEEVFADYQRTSAYPAPSLVVTQLRVVWATHRLSGAFASEEATFLHALLQP